MYKKNTSKEKYMRAIVSGFLYLILFSAFAERLKSQETPKLDKPFKLCRTYPNNVGTTKLVASDNDKSIIFTNENNYLLSINPTIELENWRSETGGKIYPAVISDKESVFFLSSFENEKKETTFILNSISQKTGITNWQKKLDGYANISLSKTYNEKTLFLTSESQNILAIRKEDGNINWTKNITPKILSITPVTMDQISILTEESLVVLSNKGGEYLYETKIKKNPVSNSINNNSYLLLGYSNGEFVKVSSGNGKVGDIIWRIKAGGSISSVIEIEDEVLVSSFDNFLYMYSITSGKLKWKRRVSGRINIKPMIINGHAIVLSSTDNIASVIELDEGKIVNQIKIEEGNYFSDEPLISGKFIIFPTFRGVQLFVNSDIDCK